MSDVTDENSKNQQESVEESELESSNETGGGKAQTKPNILRGASYMVLLIAAVFCDTRSNDKKLLPSTLEGV